MNILAYAHDGPGPWILFFPLIWAAVLVAIFFVLRRTVWRGRRGPCHPGHENAPMAVLGRRYATGEIDEDEYRRRRAVLDERYGPGQQGRDTGTKGGAA
ncbi:SHOCT domain-containing protein [Streptomyces odontomachi]|uniref:SHOCT domain-containing protein n=1 Tax=Streptomyces odontomachi TaxID=2944940 RepID=UPI00210CE254|nr:SHOCT domain-containing protein [Streptomyces sp. ODS25]